MTLISSQRPRYLSFLVLLLVLPCFCSTAVSQEASSNSYQLPETDDGLPGVGPIRRYGWFKNLWNRKRTEWSGQVQKDQGAVVFLGDSITQGWGPDFKGKFREIKVANRGISGDTTRGMLVRLKEDVLSLNPEAVVMLMGTNDLEEKATPEQIAENFKSIIDELKAHNSSMPIIVSLVFPSSAEKSRPADKIKKVNDLYSAAVKGDPQVIVLDTWTLFANSKGDAKVWEFPDLLHPNKKGYDKWAGALRPIFATLGYWETESDDFKLEEGYESLFNGKNLDGWCYRVPSEQMRKSRERMKARFAWPLVSERKNFKDISVTEDKRYAAIHDRLVVTTPPEGRKIQQIWTQREFDTDFTLKLEFRATPNADSGIFLRGKQLQCRDFLLAGPYKELKMFKQGEWNEIEIVVKDDVAHCTCNGEVLEEAFAIPKAGPIGLEGDRGQIEYRRIRIKTE